MGLGLVLYLFICLLLIATSLLNQSQTGGLGILSGSSSGMLGSAQATFLSKVISFLAIAFFLGALFFSIISSGERSLLDTFESTPSEQTTEPVPTDDLLGDPTLEDIAPEDVPSDSGLSSPEILPEEDALIPLTPIEEPELEPATPSN